jgi:hypothetical protein
MYKSFQEYMDVKKSGSKPHLVEKPPEKTVADFPGEPNPVEKPPKKQKNIKDNQVKEGHKTYKTFQEYLGVKGYSGKGEMQGKPNIDMGDKNFIDPKSPPTASIPPSKLSAGKALPYEAGKGMKAKDKGLGDLGCCPADKITLGSEMEFKQTLPKGKVKGVPQVESVLHNMNLAEATAYLAENAEADIPLVTSYAQGKFHPNPLEAIEYVAHLANVNPQLMETLIRSLKRKDQGMSRLIERLVEHPELYPEIVKSFEGTNGAKFANAMCRAMTYTESALSPPIGFKDEEEEEEEEENDKFKKPNFDDEPEAEAGEEGMPEEPEDDLGPEEDEGEFGPEPEEGPFGIKKPKQRPDFMLGSIHKDDKGPKGLPDEIDFDDDEADFGPPSEECPDELGDDDEDIEGIEDFESEEDMDDNPFGIKKPKQRPDFMLGSIHKDDNGPEGLEPEDEFDDEEFDFGPEEDEEEDEEDFSFDSEEEDKPWGRIPKKKREPSAFENVMQAMKRYTH